MASIEEVLKPYYGKVYPIEALEKLHTKQLIHINRGCYKNVCSCGVSHCDFYHDSEQYKREQENIKNIKAVLATREHVPSRAESKRARIARIKKGR